MSHIHTRATNQNRHPGLPDMPALRRSSEAVQKELAAFKAAASEAKVQQQQNIHCVAETENELQERSVQRQAAFAQPTSKITCKPKLTRSATILNVTATPQGQKLERTETLLDTTDIPCGKIKAQETVCLAAQGECQRPGWTLANNLGRNRQ